ncbi:MAG: aminotransferase class V-fold PLP-dependent enzyme [Candidatus Krumholzibacteria bacterium]|nr:aminotransferase class V-fold PLP-dependent enzyme [Candidatus Krumholzibacteria bacterium]
MDQNDKTGIWKDIRDEFPVSNDTVYFNHAAISPLSVTTRQELDRLSALLGGGASAEKEVFARVAEVRSAAADLIGARPDEIAFVKNTTHGVQIASGGIRWKKGDNVVLPSIEFPANIYPWMGLWQRGVELRMVEPDEGLVTADMLADVCDSRTRAITVSQVQFSTGQRIDLGELGDFCRNKDIFLHVDGIQGLGALELDVKKSKIDFLSVGGHKWMMALPGVGIFFCRKELLDRIDIWNPGWTGVMKPMDFLDYDFTYRDSAERFEEGSPNLHGIFALGISIDRILRLGKTTIEKRIMSLAGLLIEGLTEKGFMIKSPLGDGQRSGILCFYNESEDAQSIFDRLRDAGVICSLRENTVRLSPHMYNTEDECRFVLKTAAGH